MRTLYLLNSVAVGLFGMILSVAFCDILWTRQKRGILLGSMAMLLIFQGIVYFFVDPALVEKLYPLITHLPLVLVLCLLSKKRLWPVISVLTAYLCCQIRRWLALLIALLFSEGRLAQDVAELSLTLPLLLLLLHFIAPAIRSVSHNATAIQCQFGLVPLLYYCFDYLARVYTDLLASGSLAALEFMPFVCCISYLMYISRTSASERIRSHLEQTRAGLSLQVAQAVREIEALRESQKKASAYRHDLRHHMQFISSCIDNGRLEQAQTYIREICSEIEAGKVTLFCENETANLILSAFAKRAEEQDIPIHIQASLSQNIILSESDLCVLVSNALENALHACQKLKQEGIRGNIDVTVYNKCEKFFLQVTNSCGEDILFSQGIPVTANPGHGLGIRSICAIVEKYGGIYAFSVRDNRFILRLSL